MPQSIGASIANLFAACRDIYADSKGSDDEPVLVAFGTPGQYQPNAIVAVGWALRMPIQRPTMSPGRSRSMGGNGAPSAEIDVVMSIYVPGDESSAPLAVAAALDLQAALETYFRTSGNEKLGGACYDAFVSNAHVEQSVAYQKNDDPEVQPVATGRIATNTVTVSVFVRY